MPGTVLLLLGRLARSFPGAPALQDQLHFHSEAAVAMFYSAEPRGESVLPATDLGVKEAMGVGSSMASSPSFQDLLQLDSLPLFSVTGGPRVPQHSQVSLKPHQAQQHSPGEAAADGGSTALPFPAVCWDTLTNPLPQSGETAAPASEPGNPSHSSTVLFPALLRVKGSGCV